MDLGLQGKRAIVCASSKGLGRACAEALANEGASIVLNGRTEDVLRRTADEIASAYGVSVTPVVADIASEDGRAAVLEAAGPVDILVNNAGGPPPGDYKTWGRDDWIAAVDQNMITPIAMMQAVLPHMIDQRWGRIVNITSGAVKAPIPVLGLSNGARAGLTGFVAGLSRQVAQHNVAINNLLPGPFETDRINGLMGFIGKAQGRSAEDVKAERMASNPTGHFGDPKDFGAFCALLCSQYAGYVVGQNLLMDGGASNSTL